MDWNTILDVASTICIILGILIIRYGFAQVIANIMKNDKNPTRNYTEAITKAYILFAFAILLILAKFLI